MTAVVAAAVLAAVIAAPGRAGAQASGERISSYDARIVIRHDGSILVTEQIVYDFGTDQRHGIIRVIPVRLRYNDRYDRIYPIDVRTVGADTPHYGYSVDSSGPSMSIKIGNPDLTVSGVHAYVITYVVRGSLNAFADHDELYWNVVGNQWDVPIDRATVRVSAPEAVSRAACYAGPAGSAGACQHATVTGGAASFSQQGLGPHEGLTVVVAVPKGAVTSAGPILQQRWSLQRAFALTPVSAGASGGLLVLLLIAGGVVLARGRDRQYSTSSAHMVAGHPVQDEKAVPLSGHHDGQDRMQSAPPPDVRPGQAGTLIDGAANPRDVTGTIVDLAVRGYLRIEDAPGPEVSRDWRLVRLNKTDGLLDYERILLDGLFKHAGTHGRARSCLLSELGDSFAGSLKLAQGALYADVVERGWFTDRPDWIRRRWRIAGGALFAVGLVATIAAAASTQYGLVPVPVALAGLALIVCARWMPVRTAKGTDLARKLLGFRGYIITASPGRAHPAGQDALDAYLPYAIVFGCTKEWADLTAAVDDADRAPSWYRTSQPFSPGSLSAGLSRSAYYFSSMHHFTTTANNWVTSAASGQGGGFSGFSGGFSGGGGGGGGGGSW